MAVEHAITSSPTAPRRAVGVRCNLAGRVETATDLVAEEHPVALVYQGVPHVVMLASPADLEDLAVGFTLTEGIVAHSSEIRAVEVMSKHDSLSVHLQITGKRFSALLQRKRDLATRGGCGVESIGKALRHLQAIGKDFRVGREELLAQLGKLRSKQELNSLTGSVHAAAWALSGKGTHIVREDVGVRNPVDKVIGALVHSNIECSNGYLIFTSGITYEIVHKAAAMGIPLIATISAPTAMAIDFAERAGVTLIGFAGADLCVVYTHPKRVQP